MTDLENELRGLGADLPYPPTPDLVPVVAARLAAGHRQSRLPGRRAFALAAAALTLAGGTAVGAVSSLRHAVLDWLGLRSVRIERVPRLPRLPTGPAGRGLGLGHRTTLSVARSRVSFRLLAPSRVPPEIYIANSPPGGQVSFVYPPRPNLPRAPGTGAGLLIAEFRGQQPRAYVMKSVGPGTSVQFITVGGDPGVWISGRPHQFAFLDAGGKARAETLRLASNTLLWRHGQVLIRLEGKISRQAALRIALSLR